MAYLLDTHIILWWLSDPKKINTKTRAIIVDKTNDIFISSVFFWEISIKKSIGRLSYPNNLLHLLTEEGFLLLPILPEDGLGVGDLPLIHTDPFDRMLIIQAKLRNLVLITRDVHIPKYPVITLKG